VICWLSSATTRSATSCIDFFLPQSGLDLIPAWYD
jgi:hypothetical protein